MTTTTTLQSAIDSARATVAHALADAMRAAVLRAIERTDFSRLAAEALEGADIGDPGAIEEAATEFLRSHDWGIEL